MDDTHTGRHTNPDHSDQDERWRQGEDRYRHEAADAGGRDGDRSHRGRGHHADRGQSDDGRPDRPGEHQGHQGYGARWDHDADRQPHAAGPRDGWAKPSTRGDGYGGERGFLDRAGDEIASWFGDEGATRRREEDHRGRGPSDYTRSDERIRDDVNDRLTDDWRVDARRVSVTVDAGEVTLDGTVTSRQAKRRAEDVADDVSGVKHVQNNLRIAESPPADPRDFVQTWAPVADSDRI